MANKKPIAAPVLYLHCKCDSCKAWEIVFDPNDSNYYLKCASCEEKIKVYLDLGQPHPALHWDK